MKRSIVFATVVLSAISISLSKGRRQGMRPNRSPIFFVGGLLVFAMSSVVGAPSTLFGEPPATKAPPCKLSLTNNFPPGISKYFTAENAAQYFCTGPVPTNIALSSLGNSTSPLPLFISVTLGDISKNGYNIKLNHSSSWGYWISQTTISTVMFAAALWFVRTVAFTASGPDLLNNAGTVIFAVTVQNGGNSLRFFGENDPNSTVQFSFDPVLGVWIWKRTLSSRNQIVRLVR